MKKYMSPGRVIALGFFVIIVIGTILFMLPVSQKDPGSISFTDAFFTSTSAVCVTGLSTFDAGSVLSPFGQAVLALLIQFGGLGFASISIGIVMLTGQKVFFKQQTLVKEALNYGSMGGIITLVKSVLFITLLFEGIGAILFFTIFIREAPFLKALGQSIFHSISSFNNAGFDIFGNGDSLVSKNGNAPLIILTALLIISGGIGYLVIKEVVYKRRFKKFSLHTKVVLTTSLILLVFGTVFFRLVENYGWLDSFFMSTSTRTAGFTSVDLSEISNAGIMVYAFLMFIGASPTSTGGGIKTTTFFIILAAIYSYPKASNPTIFKRTINKEVLYKAFIIFTIGIGIVIVSLFFLCASNPNLPFKDLFFETVSAFGTVGLSTGITPTLSLAGKYIIIITMFIGRIGPLTLISLWINKKTSKTSYAEESLTLG